MSLKTTVITDFRPKAHIMPNLRMCKEKMAQNSHKCFPITEISHYHRKSGLLIAESNGVVRIVAEARNLAFLRMRRKNVAKINKNMAKSPTFRNFYRKSTSLRTTVTTEFGPEVQVTAFMRMRKKKWWKTALDAIRSSKFLTKSGLIKWRCQNCSQTLGNCLHCACACELKCGEKQRNFVKSPKLRYWLWGNRCRWKRRWEQISDRN